MLRVLANKLINPVFMFSKFTNQKYGSFKQVKLKQSDLIVTYCRSQGPGGQNVNKVNSKAEVRINLNACSWIQPEVIAKIRNSQANSINQEGQLIVTSQVHRQQNKNLDECHRKLKKIIFTNSLVKKQRIINQYVQSDSAKQKRISQKKRRSEFKQLRKKPKNIDY